MVAGSFLYSCLFFSVFAYQLGKKPLITHGATETSGYENQPVSLQCRVNSAVPAAIDWYLNGSKVPETSAFRTESAKLPDGLLISVLVIRISSSTVGLYYCNATNEFGWSVSSPANVYVAFMGDEFAVEPQSKAASVGETVVFACQPPSGSPKPTITWFKDDKEVELSDRIHLMDETNLRIEQITWADAGSYSCVAKSLAFEKCSRKAFLRVHQRPFFLVAPESQSVSINGAVEFVCRVSGDPFPTLTWRRDPPILTVPTSRSVLLPDGSLKLTNIQLEDSGDYVCQASSDGGIVEAVAHLTVTSPPGFVKTPPGNAVFLEGTRAQLMCLATGSPVPEIRWINHKTSEYYLLGVTSPSDRILVDEAGSLMIKTTRLSDSGMYECRASSLAGFTRTVIHLFVQPNPHLFPGRVGVVSKSPVQVNNFRSKDELKLFCSSPNLAEFYEYMKYGAWNTSEVDNFSAHTTFKVFWYKEKLEIALSASWKDRFRLEPDNSLVIDPSFKNGIGNYSCMILGLINKRIAFWHIQLAVGPIPEHNDRLLSPPVPPSPPSNVVVQDVGDTWVFLSWDYNHGSELESGVKFHVFYLLQFHNSSYISNRRVKTFSSIHISQDITYPNYEDSVEPEAIDDDQYPLDLWESAAESTRERSFRLKGLLPDSGYWIEVRSFTSHMWSQGALVNRVVYTTRMAPTSQLSESHPLEPRKIGENYDKLSARVNSLRFLGVSVRSLSSSEMFINWTVRTNSGAMRLIDGFQIIAKPVFMSRCSARAISVVRDRLNPALFGMGEYARLGYENIVYNSPEWNHCSFNSEQLIERFRQASANAGMVLEQIKVSEKFLIVPRTITRESPSTGAVLGGLHPFTCYEVSVKAFKDDYTYGRIWSRETPAELALSLDAAPSKAPQIISANWLNGATSHYTVPTPTAFGNFSYYSNGYAAASNGIRVTWSPLGLHLAHGTLTGYSIHLIANDSSYTQSQKVSPDVNTHDLIGLNPNIEYTIFLAGITCRGEGVRGPGYRMPVFGKIIHSSSPSKFQTSASFFPSWAYGAVSGVAIAWLLVGFLLVFCLRRRKSQQTSPHYCCFGKFTSTNLSKQDHVPFQMSTRNKNNAFFAPNASPETKVGHLIPPITETQDYQAGDHQAVSLLHVKSSKSGGTEVQRLLKSVEGAGEPIVQTTSSSSSTPINAMSSQGCHKGRCLPLTSSVPFPTNAAMFQPTTPATHNLINGNSSFSSQPPNGQVIGYAIQWSDSQAPSSEGAGGAGPPEVPPYASSNVLPLELDQSSWKPSSEVPAAGVFQTTWSNYPPRSQQQQQTSPLSGNAVPPIPPPPPYPPPPLPVSNPVSGQCLPVPVPLHADGPQEQFRHLSDDGSLPSGGSM
ncbi:unnamed protein product [Mesocestoides corti]|uniref:Uncharacterized protein n=1 Tax=Mesocestoides corti TaxID=53468 RepID=A0A0R3U4R5_MESCO|nr:unnamed protein product [Mesocestoides corti]